MQVRLHKPPWRKPQLLAGRQSLPQTAVIPAVSAAPCILAAVQGEASSPDMRLLVPKMEPRLRRVRANTTGTPHSAASWQISAMSAPGCAERAGRGALPCRQG